MSQSAVTVRSSQRSPRQYSPPATKQHCDVCDGTIHKSEKVNNAVRQALKVLRKERCERKLAAGGFTPEEIAEAQAHSVRLAVGSTRVLSVY